MNKLDQKELSAYRELAEHVGSILAKRWTDERRIASSDVRQTIPGNSPTNARKNKLRKRFGANCEY